MSRMFYLPYNKHNKTHHDLIINLTDMIFPFSCPTLRSIHAYIVLLKISRKLKDMGGILVERRGEEMLTERARTDQETVRRRRETNTRVTRDVDKAGIKS